jgi:enoyl-CoA hydratase
VAGKGPRAVAQAKRLLVAGADADLGVANALEQSAFGAVFATADAIEGMDAFLAKRDPKFEGR